MKDKARKITAMGALCALAYTATAVGRVPLVLFLKYDPKDAVIAAGGLIWSSGRWPRLRSRWRFPWRRCLQSVKTAFWAG